MCLTLIKEVIWLVKDARFWWELLDQLDRLHLSDEVLCVGGFPGPMQLVSRPKGCADRYS